MNSQQSRQAVALRGAAQIEYDAGRPEAVSLLQQLLRLRPADATGHGM
jgi:hypothetical protein